MSSPLKTFFIEPTGRQQLFLRRYHSDDDACPCPCPCPCPVHGYHDSQVFVGECDEIRDAEGYIANQKTESYEDDLRWPTKCECGYTFKPGDARQVFTESLYRRRATGEVFSFRNPPPGSIWNAPWLPDSWAGPDGLRLIARTPDGHDWTIDGRASNCTELCKKCGRPYRQHTNRQGDACSGFERTDNHKCWTRNTDLDCLDVGKNYGPTCQAGAGSIMTEKWHGFLHKGFFVEC